MALITCPECGRQISDKADACVGCGYPIKHESYEEMLKRINRRLEDFDKEIDEYLKPKPHYDHLSFPSTGIFGS